MIREEGYQAEEHTVITEDGYLLKTHRIPGKSEAPSVLLQHGLLSNSFDFVVMGKNKSLGIKKKKKNLPNKIKYYFFFCMKIVLYFHR